jgi:hypothetical protein
MTQNSHEQGRWVQCCACVRRKECTGSVHNPCCAWGTSVFVASLSAPTCQERTTDPCSCKWIFVKYDQVSEWRYDSTFCECCWSANSCACMLHWPQPTPYALLSFPIVCS